jgi:hypothetical protein
MNIATGNFRFLSDVLDNLSKNTPNKEKVESPIHAFYRLIGFPVVAKDFSYYSPGFLKTNDVKTTLDKKEKVFNKIDPKFLELSNFREGNIFDTLPKLYKQQSLDSSIFILSWINIREFDYLKKTSGAFDFNYKNQSYKIPYTDIYGNDFSTYKDVSGKPPTATNKETITNRYHIIKPFMVNPIIELTAPSKKQVAAPFSLSNEEKTISNNPDIILIAPVIEEVIKEKFAKNTLSASDKDQNSNTIVSYLKNFSTLKDNNIVKQINTNKFNIDAGFYFIKFLDILNELVKTLHNYIQVFNSQSQYTHIIPQYDNNKIVVLSPYFQDPYKKLQDDLVFNYLIELEVSSILESLPGVNKEGHVDVKETIIYRGLTFPSSKNTELTGAIKKRDKQCTSALQALVSIDYITGEFIGLGYIDILVILTALRLISREALCSIIDDDAFARMKILIPDAKTIKRMSIDAAMKEYDDKVNELYSIAQIQYKNSWTTL